MDNDGGATSWESGELGSAISQAANRIGDLEHAVEALETRTGPLQGPPPAQSEEPGKEPAAKRSMVTEAVQVLVPRLEVLKLRVETITERLEI